MPAVLWQETTEGMASPTAINYMSQVDGGKITAANLGAFSNFCQSMGQEDHRLLNFWSQVARLENRVLPYPIGFQGTTQDARIAEVIYSYFRPNGLLDTRNVILYAAAQVMANAFPGGNLPDRSHNTFNTLIQYWLAHPPQPNTNALMAELTTVKDLDGLKKKLNFRLNQFTQMTARMNNQAYHNSLNEIRQHQRVKLDKKHKSGKFWMITRSVDGNPILLVSSKLTKNIDQNYIDAATGLNCLPYRIVQGTYAVDTAHRTITLDCTVKPAGITGAEGQTAINALNLVKFGGAVTAVVT
jgi:hypothetical protein